MNSWRAAIDIGSNSIRLLTAREENGVLLERQKIKRRTRLASGVESSGNLQSENMTQSIAALSEFKSIINELHIDKCPVFATSAIRDADNKADFLAMVKTNTGFEIDIITGEKEATLGYFGVKKGLQLDDDIVVIDIGGASTELIIGKGDKIVYAHSFDIGAVRLTERFDFGHSMELSALEPLEQLVESLLSTEKIRSKLPKSYKVVGIGGTTTTVAAIVQSLTAYDSDKVHNYVTTMQRISALACELCQASADEKLAIQGLESERIDIITAGVAILNAILKYIGASNIYFSDYDNLEGALFALEREDEN